MSTHRNPPDEAIRAFLESSKVVAMVGASSKPDRPSHGIMRLLLDAGFTVIPVSPRETEVLGKRAYATLADVPEKIDIVDVFRRAEDTPEIADDAVTIGARALWLQLGIASDEAAEKAAAGGLFVVMDRCLGATVREMGIRKT